MQSSPALYRRRCDSTPDAPRYRSNEDVSESLPGKSTTAGAIAPLKLSEDGAESAASCCAATDERNRRCTGWLPSCGRLLAGCIRPPRCSWASTAATTVRYMTTVYHPETAKARAARMRSTVKSATYATGNIFRLAWAFAARCKLTTAGWRVWIGVSPNLGEANPLASFCKLITHELTCVLIRSEAVLPRTRPATLAAHCRTAFIFHTFRKRRNSGLPAFNVRR